MSEPSEAGPTLKATSRFAVFSPIFGGLALLDAIAGALSILELRLSGIISESFSDIASSVAFVLIPIFCVVGLVFGVVGRRRSTKSRGRILAIVGIVVNSVLLAVGLLIYGLAILIHFL
jgi:hypothetical protein